MADELTPEMLQEAQPDLLTLEDEDGKECTFEVIDATEVNGTRYLAVIPYQEDPESLDEEAELILMRIGTDEAGEYMDIVDDDEELLTVGKVFDLLQLYIILLINLWEPGFVPRRIADLPPRVYTASGRRERDCGCRAPTCHITVGFDWLQTAARDFLYTLQGKGMPFPFFFALPRCARLKNAA